MVSVYGIAIYILCFVLGIISITYQISDETIVKLKKNWITRFTIAKHFQLSRKVYNIIGQSVQAGTLGGSIRFIFGLLIIYIYFFLIGLAIYLIEMWIYAIFQVLSPNYMTSFSLMLGAGIAAFLLWHIKLHQEIKEIKAQWKADRAINKIGKAFSRTFKAITLLFSYILWVIGEIFFLNLSPDYSSAIGPYFLGFVVVFFILLGIFFFISTLFSKADMEITK